MRRIVAVSNLAEPMILSGEKRPDGNLFLALSGGLDLQSDESFLEQWTALINEVAATTYHKSMAVQTRPIVYLDLSDAFIDGRGIRILEVACRYAGSLEIRVLIIASSKTMRAVRFSTLLKQLIHQNEPSSN